MIEKTRVRWLDVCRTIAICLVLLSHGRVFLTPVAPWAQQFKFGGFIGVELFFVLSGLLIGTIMIKEIENSNSRLGWIPNFWSRRWLRTLPNYILFLGLNIFIAHNIRPAELPNLLQYLTFTQNLTSPHPPFFGEAWSLAVEEIFYLLTPLIIATFMLVTRSGPKAILAAAVSIIVISILARTCVVLDQSPTFNSIRSTGLLRLDALMVGVACALAITQNKFSTKLITSASIIALPLFFVSAYIATAEDSTIDSSILYKIFLFNITSAGCAGLIVGFRNIKVHRAIDCITSRIARWSYSAYLTNLPVLFTIKYFFPANTSVFESITLWLYYLAGTIITAFLVYRFFELKFLSLREKITKTRKQKISAT